MVQSLMANLNAMAFILMLAALHGSESVGVHEAVVRDGELVVFSLVIADMTIQPSFARLHTTGDTACLQSLVALSTRGAVAAGTSLILWNLLPVVFVQWRLGMDAAALGFERINLSHSGKIKA